MNMDNTLGVAIVTAVSTVSIAVVNMVGSVLLQWIRARYHISDQHNGTQPGSNLQPPH